MSIYSEGLADVALLTVEDMARADSMAIEGGMPFSRLVQAAGQAVGSGVRREFPAAASIAILAGTGHNGEDAVAAARSLRAEKLSVTLYAADLETLPAPDAAMALRASGIAVEPLDAYEPSNFDLVVDGLLGAGLSRPVVGAMASAIRRTNASAVPVLAIDLPSGISGDTGAIRGTAIQADVTVTFFRRKPGHLLQPGRSHCGRTSVADIGIPAGVLDRIRPRSFANEPALWRGAFPSPAVAGHKYDRGHAVIFSGGAATTGAARLAAVAALRAGAGLTTVFSPGSAMLVNAMHLTAVMLKRCDALADLQAHLEDERFSSFVLGPGFGAGDKARSFAAAVLEARRPLVLDADGITAFKGEPQAQALWRQVADLGGTLVLTPHLGEFKRLFPSIAEDEALSKCDKARAAAGVSGAMVVLKGADTVIAAPDGRAAINATGTPWLATAGSGDVLSGIISGLLAQGMPAFEAASAAVWMHGKAAEAFGPGLIAEDLPGQLPSVLRDLAKEQPAFIPPLALPEQACAPEAP